MKNKSNIIILTIIVIISSILFLMGCNNIFSPQNASGNTDTTIVKKTGSVSLNIAKKDYRTLLPSFSIDHIDVTGDGPLGSSVLLNDMTTDTISIINLAVGEWTITALGKDSINNTVAKGSVLININEGVTTDATIDVRYLQDTTGTVNITINWPLDVSVDSIEFKKNSIDQTADVTSDLSFTGNSLNYLDNSVESNFYTYVFKFKHNNQIIATVFQSVHIYDYLTTSATINLSASNFSAPPSSPTGLSAVEGLFSLNINWTDTSMVEEGFIIERSITSGGGFSAIGNTDVTPLPANTVNYIDDSVVIGTTYYYRILAVNSFGASPKSSEANGVLILPSISSLNPISGSTEIPANTNIIINFSENIDPAILGTVQFASPNIIFVDQSNCIMTISNNVLTINPNKDFAGATVENITIDGFQDMNGNLTTSYNDATYNFTVNGMIAYYPFNGNADDMSGNVNNMTFTTINTWSSIPMQTADRYGLPDSAYYMGMGYECYMDTTITTIPSSFTISAWINNSGMSMDQIVFSKYNDQSSDDKYAEMCLKKDMMGNLKFFMGNGIDLGLEINGNNNNSDGDMSNDKWHNVVITFDGTTGNMYIDGSLSGSGTFSGTRQNTTTPLYFGYYSTQMSYYWEGKLDDIRIYNYVRNETEILDTYNSEKPLPFGVLEINYPSIGQIVEPTTDIKIVFDSTMDINSGSSGMITFVNPDLMFYQSNGSFSFSSTYKSNDTVTFTPYENLPADTYSGITISGFKNAGGSTMVEYTDATYDFTIKGTVAKFLFDGNFNSVSQSYHSYSAISTSYPSTTNDRNNESGKAISFNGADNYLNSQITKLDGDFTLSAWVSYTNTTIPLARPILSKPNTSDTDSQFNLQVESNGNLNFFMGSGAAKGIILDGNNDTSYDLVENKWYHVAVTVGGTTGRLFINGIETDSGTFVGTRETGISGLLIGKYFNGTDQYFFGKIDEVHIYNYALNNTAINDIYIAERPKVYVMNILSPADGAMDVSPDANIVIQFSGSLDGTTFGTISFNQPDFSYMNGSNCLMSFSQTIKPNDTVTINPMTNFVGMQYSGINSITGFLDPSGDAMIAYSNSSYDFTTKSISLYYKFDGDAIDYSGFPGSIKLDGGAWYSLPDLTTDRHEVANKAYQFVSAQTKGIQAGGWVDIIGNEPITMSLWVKAASTDCSTDQVISVLGTSDVDATRFGLYINCTTDRVGFYGYGTANFVSDATLDTEWTHWTATYDGTTVKLYRNGIFNMSQNINLNIGNGSYGNPYVGTWSQSYSSYFFDGCIDEVRIYNYALTESEILAIYTAESTP